MPEATLFRKLAIDRHHAIVYHYRMNMTSRSSLRYFQRSGRGRHGGRDYEVLGREDPFRNGQVAFQPRLGFKLNTIERMISKPCEMQKILRTMY